MHVPLQLCRVETEFGSDAERLVFGGPAAFADQASMQLEISALQDRRLGDPRDVLRIPPEHGKFLQHEPDFAVGCDELIEVRRSIAAIWAVIVEEGDDAHVAVRIARHKALRRAEYVVGIGGDCFLLAGVAEIAHGKKGREKAQPGYAEEHKKAWRPHE